MPVLPHFPLTASSDGLSLYELPLRAPSPALDTSFRDAALLPELDGHSAVCALVAAVADTGSAHLRA